MRRLRDLPLAAAVVTVLFVVPGFSQEVKTRRGPRGAKTNVQPPAKTGAQSTQPKGKTADAGKSGTKSKAKPANPKQIRVFLMDGSVIAGELSVDVITVTTEFGKLKVPVKKIISITPGLDSHTKLSQKIDRLIKELGGPDYKAREEAQKQLLAMGPKVSDVIAEHTDSKNAELKRRATELVAKFSEMGGQFDVFDDGDENKQKAWVEHDLVVTPDFTIAGKITPSAFAVESKYGPLQVSLNDIKRAEKEFDEEEVILKKVSVPGQKLIQRGMKSARIRVKAGDTVTVAATGRITMPPWGSTANTGPEGNSRYSYFYANVNGVRTKLYGGTLVARIGSSGDFVRIGRRAKFKAKKSGTLYFGVAMSNSYTRSNYYYSGEYKLRVKVDPKN